MLLADATRGKENDYVDWLQAQHGRSEMHPGMIHGISSNGWVGRPHTLPEEQMHTRGVILTFPDDTRSGASIAGLDQAQVGPAIARLGTLVRNVAPVFLLCDPRDIGVAERVRDPHFGCPALYVYDQYPGGSGLSEAFLGKVELVMQAAVELLDGCSCAEGCPSCVGPRDPEEEIDSSPKAAVARFLAGWLGGGGGQ